MSSKFIFPCTVKNATVFFLIPEYVRYYYCKQVIYDKYLRNTAIIPLGTWRFILADNSRG